MIGLSNDAGGVVKWQPINVAPRDGTHVLLCGSKKGPIFVGYYGRSPFDREQRMGSKEGWVTIPGRHVKYPLYWMPLPALPA